MFFRKKNKTKSKILGAKCAFPRRKKENSNFPGFRKILFYILEMVFVGTVIYLLFFSPFLMINKIEIQGAEKIDAGEAESFVKEKISGKFLGFIPKDNLALFFNGGMEKKLQDKFKRLETAEVKKIFPEKIRISMTEKKFRLIFSDGKSAYLIDDLGRAWPREDFELKGDEEELVVFTDKSGKEVADKNQALEAELVEYVLEVKEKIENEAGIETGSNFSSPRLISGDLEVETASGWKIHFNREIPLDKSIETLKLVLNEKIKEEAKNLEYVDLRIKNKVYYKLKNTDSNQENQKKDDDSNL